MGEGDGDTEHVDLGPGKAGVVPVGIGADSVGGGRRCSSEEGE